MGTVPGQKTTVAIQTIAYVSNGKGGQIPTATTVFSKEATWVGITGFEVQRGGQQTAFDTERIHLEYDDETATITTKHQVKYGTEVWDIVRVYDPGQIHHHIELTIRMHTV